MPGPVAFANPTRPSRGRGQRLLAAPRQLGPWCTGRTAGATSVAARTASSASLHGQARPQPPAAGVRRPRRPWPGPPRSQRGVLDWLQPRRWQVVPLPVVLPCLGFRLPRNASSIDHTRPFFVHLRPLVVDFSLSFLKNRSLRPRCTAFGEGRRAQHLHRAGTTAMDRRAPPHQSASQSGARSFFS